MIRPLNRALHFESRFGSADGGRTPGQFGSRRRTYPRTVAEKTRLSERSGSGVTTGRGSGMPLVALITTVVSFSLLVARVGAGSRDRDGTRV